MSKTNGPNRHACAAALLMMFTTAFGGNAFAYCTSNGSNSSYEWMSEVAVDGFFNSSGNNGGYGDFTGQTIDLTMGTHGLMLTPGFGSSSYSEYWKIWIDFNQDSEFTEDESVFSGSSSGTISSTMTIPQSVNGGMTRMRVSMRYGATPTPCGTFVYGEVEDYTVNLNIVDTTAPTVVSTSPAGDAIDVPVNAQIVVNFSEDVDPQTINNDSISLVSNGVPVAGVVASHGAVATFTPDQALEFSTGYTVTVHQGVLDLAGNPLVQDEVWSFTTAAPDIVLPSISQASPQDGTIDVDRNFVLQALFSEPMDPATINADTFIVSDGVNAVAGSVVLNGDGYTAQFYPSQSYDYMTTYTATITRDAKDLAGNAMEADYSWSFTTRASEPVYCSSHASNYSYLWIAAVKVGSYTHSSPSQPYVGYSDHTATVFDLSRWFSRSITLTPGYSSSAYTVYWRVFIDWNQDGVFDSDETAFSGYGKNAVTGAISVPQTALSGNTRMRVAVNYSAYPPSCGSFSYGEVEDYRVNIPSP